MGFFKTDEEKELQRIQRLNKDLFSKKPHVVQEAIAAGANVNVHDVDNDITPLFVALSGERFDIAKMLIEAGASVDFIQKKTNTSLLTAAASRYNEPYEIVQILIDRGAPLNTAEHYQGWTAMHYAAERGHGRVIRMLLDKGADYKATDNRMNMPYDIAEKHSYTKQIARLLKEHAEIHDPKPIAVVETSKPVALVTPKTSDWHLTAEDEVARVSDKAAIGYRITEIFNFGARCYTRIARNIDTGAESQVMRLFGELSSAGELLAEAQRELLGRGGKMPSDEAFLEKPVVLQAARP